MLYQRRNHIVRHGRRKRELDIYPEYVATSDPVHDMCSDADLEAESYHDTEGDTSSKMNVARVCRLISQGAREW